jgi:hypothetical protein
MIDASWEFAYDFVISSQERARLRTAKNSSRDSD